jgi:hypothetical protein
MSDFKFACPVCGQHITCDSGSSGSHMDCPTCFRKLVVPQAPAPGAAGFVLTASEANKRTAVLPKYTEPKTLAPKPKQFPVLPVAIGVVVVALIAVGAIVLLKSEKSELGAKQETQTDSVAKTNATVVATVVLAPADASATNWTLNLDEVKMTDSPANGAVNGFGFNIEKAVINEGRLDLRQGAKWPPDTGISIHLLAKRVEDIAGKTVIIEPERTNSPKVILRWKKSDGKAASREFTGGYVARIEFGAIKSKSLPGKIFIATPDDLKSYVSGTFNAEIRRPASSNKQR